MKRFLLFWLAGIFLLQACDPFEYHPYEVRLGKKYRDINARNIERIRKQDVQKDTFRFVFVGDTQRWYDETEDFVKDVNKRDDIEFVVQGGDISDFGVAKEYCWMHDIFSKLKVPYVAILGNHDVLGTGGQVYRKMYGEFNFSFVFGKTKFVCLNTNALDFDYGIQIPDFDYMRKDIADSVGVAQTIVMMHTPPKDVVFNNNVNDIFHYGVKQYPHLLCCIHAHQHRLEQRDLFEDGMMYYGADMLKNRNYYLFTVTEHGYEYEVIYF